MFYLVMQTILFLAIAAVFGGVIGWLLRSVRCRSQLAAMQKNSAGAAGDDAATLQTLRARVADQDREISSLRAERDKLSSQPTVVSEKVAAVKSRVASKRAGRVVSLGPDDLQRIHGIGPVLEKKLHEMGITRFEQIASLKEKDIESIAQKIGAFPDRIRRDNWKKSARELAQRRN